MTIKSTTSVRNLGVIIDNKMHFDEQIKKVARGCYFELSKIARNRRFFTPKITQTLITSLVMSKLNFCCTLYQGLPANQLSKLQKVQNLAARIITHTPRRNHITPALKKLGWLKIEHFIEFRIACVTFKCLKTQKPAYLYELLTP